MKRSCKSTAFFGTLIPFQHIKNLFSQYIHNKEGYFSFPERLKFSYQREYFVCELFHQSTIVYRLCSFFIILHFFLGFFPQLLTNLVVVNFPNITFRK